MEAKAAKPEKLSRRYVDFESGWRLFFVCLAVAAVFGFGFKAYFTPKRITRWVNEAIAREQSRSSSGSAAKTAIEFDSAELKLRQGLQPHLAVVLKKLRLSPNPACVVEPSVEIDELRLPLRLVSLLSGKPAIGRLTADGVRVDLDRLKKRCDRGEDAESSANSQANSQGAIQSDERAPTPWWSEARLRDVESVVQGLDFSNVEVLFEARKKSVFLDSFTAEIGSQEVIDFASELRIPPQTAYGEKLPTFLIEGTASAQRADVKINARIDEGEMEASASLAPGPNQTLQVDAIMGVGSLPLSTIMPLMRKVSLASEKFQPKFLWLNCSARVRGNFQKLFAENPIYLENCSLEGDGTKLALEKAVRHPEGSWEPFEIRIEALELGKFLKTISAVVPEGVVSHLGRVHGKVSVKNADSANFEGSLRATRLSFSSQRVRAEQEIDRAALRATFDGRVFRGHIDKIELHEGKADARVDLEFEPGLKNGNVMVLLDNVDFAPAVQSVLVKGTLGALSGSAVAKIQNGVLNALDAKLKFGRTAGRDIRFSTADIALDKPAAGAALKMKFEAHDPSIQEESQIFAAFKPLFFDREFAQDWISMTDFKFDSIFSDHQMVSWQDAKATFEDGQIVITSRGTMDRERKLGGWVEASYPKLKNLRWDLSGTSAKPVVTTKSEAVRKIRARLESDEEALGLVKRR